MQSVENWKKGINTNTSVNSLQPVSAWKQSQPVSPQSQFVGPQQPAPDNSFFGKAKRIGSSILSGIENIPSYLQSAVENPTQSLGTINTGVIKPLAFINKIGIEAGKLENKGLNALGIKTAPVSNGLSELSKSIDNMKRNPDQQQAYDTYSFLGYMLPYTKVTKGVELGLGAIKTFAEHPKIITAIADFAGVLGTGQILHDPKDGTRVQQLVNDMYTGLLFTGGGYIFRKAGKLIKTGLQDVLSGGAKKEVIDVMKPVTDTIASGEKVPMQTLETAVTKANDIVIKDTGKTPKEILNESITKPAVSKPVEKTTTQPKTPSQIQAQDFQSKGKSFNDFVKAQNSVKTPSYIDRLKNVYKKEKSTILKTERGSSQQARLKAVGMQTSAIKRGIEGTSTTIEKRNAINKLESIHSGRSVTVDGKTGVATGKTSFGRHEIKFSDGSTKFILGENIITKKVTSSEVTNYLKNKAISELKGKESIYGKGTTNIKKDTQQLRKIWESTKKTKEKPVEKTSSKNKTKTKPKEKPITYKRITKGAYEANLKLVQDGYDALPVDEQAQYTHKSYNTAKTKLAKMMSTDLKAVQDMAVTGKDIPKDIPEPILLNTVRLAEEAKPKNIRDYKLLRDLQNSPIHTKVSESAQTLGSHGFSKGGISTTDYLDKAVKAIRGTKKNIKSVVETKAKISRASARLIDYNNIIDKITC